VKTQRRNDAWSLCKQHLQDDADPDPSYWCHWHKKKRFTRKENFWDACTMNPWRITQKWKTEL